MPGAVPCVTTRGFRFGRAQQSRHSRTKDLEHNMSRWERYPVLLGQRRWCRPLGSKCPQHETLRLGEGSLSASCVCLDRVAHTRATRCSERCGWGVAVLHVVAHHMVPRSEIETGIQALTYAPLSVQLVLVSCSDYFGKAAIRGSAQSVGNRRAFWHVLEGAEEHDASVQIIKVRSRDTSLSVSVFGPPAVVYDC